MNKLKVYFVGLFSCFMDVSTSWLASKYPELRESNPLANPFLEAATVLAGQAVILKVGEKLKVNPGTTKAIALTPTILPFKAALTNLALVAVVEAKTYPWDECPILY